MAGEVILQCQNQECDKHAWVTKAGADTLDAYGGVCMWCGEPTLWNATAGWRVLSPLEAHQAHLQRIADKEVPDAK